MEFTTVLNFLSALAIGALIGTEREMVTQDKKSRDLAGTEFGGVRTFMLISLLGSIASYFAINTNNWNTFLVIMLSAFFLFLIHYAYNLFILRDVGATTEVAGFLTFLTGALCAANYAGIAVVLGICITAILLSKHAFLRVIPHISRKEIYSTLAFAAMLFIVWPLLPNTALDPWGIVHPQQTWSIVILISAISFVGYIASKIFGTRKGIILAGIFGGIASSTAVSSAMAEQSRAYSPITFPFVIATIIASGIMFIRACFLIFSFHPALLGHVALPIVVMAGVSIILLYTLFVRSKNTSLFHEDGEEIPLTSPFHILPAIKFAAFFLAVGAASLLATTYLGEGGTYLVAFASGLADVDAIAISLSLQSLDGTISTQVASRAIIIALLTNTIVKVALAMLFGSKKYARWILVTFSIILGSGALSLLFV